MDELTRVYRTQMRLRVEPELIATVRWYFAAPGATVYPYPHAFGSRAWETEDHPDPFLGVGEFRNTFSRVKSVIPPGQIGLATVTPPEWFADGVPAGVVGPFPLGPCPPIGEAFDLCFDLSSSSDMGAAIITTDGTRAGLYSFLDCANAWVLMLWTNDLTPTRATRRTDLVEATFPGYAVQAPTFGMPVLGGDGVARTSSIPNVWRRATGPGVQTVYGWAALDPRTRQVITLARFAAPVVMAAPGDPVVINALNLALAICGGAPAVPTTIPLSSDQDNLAIPPGPLVFAPTVNVTITGFVSLADWSFMLIYNAGPGKLTIALESVSSASANRITAPPGWASCTQFVLRPQESATVWYDPGGPRWRTVDLCTVLEPSGADHTPGYAPDAGAVAGDTKFLRETASYEVVAGGGGDIDYFYWIGGPLTGIAHELTGGRYVLPGAVSPLGTTNEPMTAHSLIARPLILPAGAVIDRLAIWVSEPDGSGINGFKLGLAADTSRMSGYPAAQLTQSSLLDATSGGFLYWDIDPPLTLGGGRYWPWAWFEGAPLVASVSNGIGGAPGVIYPVLGWQEPSIGVNEPDYAWIRFDDYTARYVSDDPAIPSPFPSLAEPLNISSAVLPAAVFVRLVSVPEPSTGGGGGGGGVTSFNGRTGAVTLLVTDVDAALPADVAQTDVANVFSATQTISAGYLETPAMKIWPNGGTGTASEFFDKMLGMYFTTQYPLQFNFDQRYGAVGAIFSAPGGAYSRLDLQYGSVHGYVNVYHNGAIEITGVDGVPVAAQAPSATTPALLVRGVAGQTAVLSQLQGVSSTGAIRPQASLDTFAVDNTDATRMYRFLVSAWDTAAREGLRVEADGSQALVSVYGVPAVARQLLATGAGHTVDDVITVLQTFGIARQS